MDAYFTSDDDESRSGRRSLCGSRNAVMARENRVRKKQYVVSLERQVAALRAEKRRARALAEDRLLLVRDLQHEVRYLRAVLANSKQIGCLVRKLKATPQETEPPRDDAFFGKLYDDELFPETKGLCDATLPTDHTYSACVPTFGGYEPKDVGVCLHVANERMSLEFCSICNERAIKNWEFDGV